MGDREFAYLTCSATLEGDGHAQRVRAVDMPGGSGPPDDSSTDGRRDASWCLGWC